MLRWGGPAPARWINHDHITRLIPVTRQGESDVELVVDFKLQGLPRAGGTSADIATWRSLTRPGNSQSSP
jgi:hypothetical protein